MSYSIRQAAAELNVNPADIIAILNQLGEIDVADTVQTPETPAEKFEIANTIQTAGGTYENSILTPEAMASLREQFA